MKRTMQAGFTLIELVVVIVILGILAAVAIPQFTDISTAAKDAAFNATCGAVQSGAVLLYASKRTSSTTAEILANTTFSGLESAPTVTGACIISIQIKSDVVRACPAIPAPLCS